jgi:hypothetical protein
MPVDAAAAPYHPHSCMGPSRNRIHTRPELAQLVDLFNSSNSGPPKDVCEQQSVGPPTCSSTRLQRLHLRLFHMAREHCHVHICMPPFHMMPYVTGARPAPSG